jgi:uncharacterized protein
VPHANGTRAKRRAETISTNLSSDDERELVRVVERLVAAFRPDRIYLFGSQARGEATPDSDVDLLVVVPNADRPPYQLDQEAYRIVAPHSLRLEIIVIPRGEFAWRSRSPASLPATVLREGRLLYAA